MKDVTRRDFIFDGALITGAAITTLAIGVAVVSPGTARAAKAVFPESRCGVENKNGRRVLIAYGSYCGSTAGVAESIGKVLCDNGATVDIRRVESVRDLSPYQAVIIGSAVHSGKWLPNAAQFVETNQNILSKKPTAYFLTCLALYKSNKETRRIAQSYMEPMLEAVPRVRPVDIGLFAGVLDYGTLSFVVRMVMKSKMKKKGVPEGDHRDWDAIRSWAEGLCPKLLHA